MIRTARKKRCEPYIVWRIVEFPITFSASTLHLSIVFHGTLRSLSLDTLTFIRYNYVKINVELTSSHSQGQSGLTISVRNPKKRLTDSRGMCHMDFHDQLSRYIEVVGVFSIC